MSDFERYLLLILGVNAFCTLLVSAAIVDVKTAIKGIREDLERRDYRDWSLEKARDLVR